MTEQALRPGSYGYAAELVAGADACTIAPADGDLVLFNSRNFHRVTGGGVEAERVSVSSFVGLKEDGALALWS